MQVRITSNTTTQTDRAIKFDTKQALLAAARAVQTGIGEIFQAEGPGWPRHTDSTIRRYGEHRLLVLTGDLLRDLTSGNTAVSLKGDSVSIGLPNDRKFVGHMTGISARNLPARPMIDIFAQTEDRVADAIAEALISGDSLSTPSKR